MKLYQKLPMSIEFNSVKYRLKPYFNNVLFVLETFNDDSYTDEEKIEMSFKALVKNRFVFLGLYEKTILLNKILQMLFDDKKKNTDDKKSFDFVQDSKYIYAGFMQCYGIDLFSCRNKLHWWKFISLFQGLSKDTRIMQIIEIRTKPLPKPTKYNGEERALIMKQKMEFALELTQEEREKQFTKGLNAMFDALKNMAEMR